MWKWLEEKGRYTVLKVQNRKSKIILLICNIILIIATVTAAWLYSAYIYKTQEETRVTDFFRTVDSMKQVSKNYIDSERGYAKDWSGYISKNEMTLKEAMDFLRSINTNQERFTHIIDMDTYEAYSSYYPQGKEKIDTYVKYKDQNVESEEPFGEIMENMFSGVDEDFAVLGKYRLNETQAMGVGVGTRVTLKTENGLKDYLMLRIIPVDVLKRSWVFPTDYASAEIGIITRSGDYVIQSSSMKSLNFPEYIRGYNFQDDYNEVERLRKKLETTSSGMLEYKNFRGTDCIWYYSSFGEKSALDILGVLNKDDLKVSVDVWYIIYIVCGSLVVLVLIDGLYLVGINHRLRETARISEEASKAKTQFLSAMSHDIRTPLNAVLGMMSIAQKKSHDSSYVEECMDKGIQSGKQLLTLINDVLDISKIESGKVSLNLDRVNLEKMIHGLTEMMEENIKQKGITLQCDCNMLPYKIVYADRMRLNQIYVNLLTNAVKYTNKGGKILIRLYEEAIPDNDIYTRLIFYVEDTGIGMTEEFQKHMYSTFAREINTQVNSTQGSGLGLAIVKQMVDMMNGTIECKSIIGVGTSFTVKVDLAIVEEQPVDILENELSANVENMHLLVAEDNDLNWEIFNELVSEKGVVCDRAENGQECVDMLLKAEDNTYEGILMDIHMPIMNGYEATKKIRSLDDEALRKIPIIAMTADAFAEDVQECLNCGMNGHIAKPIDMNVLMMYLYRIKNNKL